MALKLKNDPEISEQKTGSDYLNTDYSRAAEDIIKQSEAMPESRYSSSNYYSGNKVDLEKMNMEFRKEEYEKQNNIYTRLNSYDYGGRKSNSSWFGHSGGEVNELKLYLGIFILAIMIVVFFHRGMSALSDMARDTIEVEGTVTSVEHRERYVKRRKRVGRWVDEYRTTYEWVGENGEIQTGTRIYDERRFSEGDTVIVTVLSSDINQEIDSKTTAKSKAVSSLFFCFACTAGLAVCVICLKKRE